ncbi:MAG: TrpR-like protein YerC/YecD, partial [Clostridia bacterium]|nr:TrpR-like protein YerC/YecD [Clostridia bacterium]
GASTATISRVNRSLQYGADGYRLALDRLETSGLIQQKEEKDSNV